VAAAVQNLEPNLQTKIPRQTPVQLFLGVGYLISLGWGHNVQQTTLMMRRP
jgi:hypothetical protein